MGRSLRKSRNHKPVTIKRKLKKMRRLNYHDEQIAATWDLKRTLRQVSRSESQWRARGIQLY